MNPEEFIHSVINEWGFSCIKIPEANSKRPDFAVSDAEGQNYLLELKVKNESAEHSSKRSLAVEYSIIYTDVLELNARASHRSVVDDARKQLISMPGHGADTLRVPWLLCLGHQASADKERFHNLLLGSTYLVDWADEEEEEAKACHFFNESVFFTHRHSLDAAIVSTISSISLLLNPYSERFVKMKQSMLARELLDGVIDTVELDQAGEVYWVDSAIDRKDHNLVMSYVKAKYRLSDQAMAIDISELTATTCISKRTFQHPDAEDGE